MLLSSKLFLTSTGHLGSNYNTVIFFELTKEGECFQNIFLFYILVESNRSVIFDHWVILFRCTCDGPSGYFINRWLVQSFCLIVAMHHFLSLFWIRNRKVVWGIFLLELILTRWQQKKHYKKICDFCCKYRISRSGRSIFILLPPEGKVAPKRSSYL